MERKEGRGRPGAPTSSEQGSNKKESKEYQSLPSVWEVLERKARASDELLRSRMSCAQYDREQDEVTRLKEEIEEKGIDRARHILALLYNRRPRLSLLSEQQQIQQWRSQVEPLSDQGIAECAHKQKEEIEAFHRREVPILSFHPSAGDGELILAEHIAKKSKSG